VSNINRIIDAYNVQVKAVRFLGLMRKDEELINGVPFGGQATYRAQISFPKV